MLTMVEMQKILLNCDNDWKKAKKSKAHFISRPFRDNVQNKLNDISVCTFKLWEAYAEADILYHEYRIKKCIDHAFEIGEKETRAAGLFQEQMLLNSNKVHQFLMQLLVEHGWVENDMEKQISVMNETSHLLFNAVPNNRKLVEHFDMRYPELLKNLAEN